MAQEDLGAAPGNDELKKTLADAVRRGTLGHAYIIEGAAGIGKHALAKALAEAVLCTGGGVLPCGKCPSCVRAAAGSHPDIIEIGRDGKASLGVDTIRRLRADAYIMPSESERKVYIIEDADTMTAEAQNAFLLSLEEPPAYVLYLLLCRDSKALLETIRSRAPQLRMRPCERRVIESYLIDTLGRRASAIKDAEPDKWEELLVIANGNPGLALNLIQDGTLNERIAEKNDALALLTSMLDGSGDAVVGIASMKKPKRDDALAMLDDILSALRDMLVSKKTVSVEPRFFTSVEKARRASEPYTAKKLALAVDAARECASVLERNAAVTTSLLSAAIKIKNS